MKAQEVELIEGDDEALMEMGDASTETRGNVLGTHLDNGLGQFFGQCLAVPSK